MKSIGEYENEYQNEAKGRLSGLCMKMRGRILSLFEIISDLPIETPRSIKE